VAVALGLGEDAVAVEVDCGHRPPRIGPPPPFRSYPGPESEPIVVADADTLGELAARRQAHESSLISDEGRGRW
jgi:hypothetical protein